MNVVMSTSRLNRPIALYGREVLPLAFLAEAQSRGIAGALATISAIDGGAPKPLGTHLAVLADGRHMGHVSGGCVEPAIAAEILPMLSEGTDSIIRFGKGSRYVDIRFPCGGGADLLIHAAPSPDMLHEALHRAERREAFSISFDPSDSRATLAGAAAATGWQDGVFIRRYLPRPRLVLAGRGPDFEVMARVAVAAELELSLITPDAGSAEALADLGAPIELLASASQAPRTPIDPWTATVLLFHEHEWEDALLTHATASAGFYIGALGSQRTHADRRARLSATGLRPAQIERVRGPIGLVARTKEPGSLALSVLAEIAAVRAEIDRT